MSYIYVITNNVNNKQYVGKTNLSIQKRFQEHVNDSKQRIKEHRPLYNAFNKYGIDNFSIKILEECPWDEASKKEIYWIGRLNTYENAYNATLGGDGTTLYDYRELSIAYQTLGTIKKVCEQYHCDQATVKKACAEYNIQIQPSSTHLKKKVAMLDKNTEDVLQIFDSLTEAGIFLGNITKNKHIGKVCNGVRKTAYGYKWKYIE